MTFVRETIRVGGHATGIAMEPAFWEALDSIGDQLRLTRAELITHIDTKRVHGGLTSAIRVYIIEWMRGAPL